MRALDFLFVVALILVLLWLLGFFVFNLGTIIWVLLVIAIIIILYRLLTGRRI
ncbi:MAG: lmo0937 family membrane protein [Ignavibacteria bacterium]